MRPSIFVVTPPDPLLLITLVRARLQCRIDPADVARDPEVTDAIASARAWTQERLHRAVGEQTLRLTYESWCGSAVLPFDVTTLSSITVDGVAVNPLPAPVGRKITLDVTGVVVITIVTGYTPATLPGPVKSAMLLMIADLVRNLQAQTDMQLYANPAVDNLLSFYIDEVPL